MFIHRPDPIHPVRVDTPDPVFAEKGTHLDGDCRVVLLLTLNQAAVSRLVIPAQAGTQGGAARAISKDRGSRLRGNDECTLIARR